MQGHGGLVRSSIISTPVNARRITVKFCEDKIEVLHRRQPFVLVPSVVPITPIEHPRLGFGIITKLCDRDGRPFRKAFRPWRAMFPYRHRVTAECVREPDFVCQVRRRFFPRNADSFFSTRFFAAAGRGIVCSSRIYSPNISIPVTIHCHELCGLYGNGQEVSDAETAGGYSFAIRCLRNLEGSMT
jgi:hypothetical protein